MQMWWTTAGSLGRISMEVTHVSVLDGKGIATLSQSMTPRAGTRYSGNATSTSGLICQPFDGHAIGGGASLAAPSTAPPSAHRRIVSTSAGLSDRSLVKLPCAGSANQGGIDRSATFERMALAQGRVC